MNWDYANGLPLIAAISLPFWFLFTMFAATDLSWPRDRHEWVEALSFAGVYSVFATLATWGLVSLIRVLP